MQSRALQIEHMCLKTAGCVFVTAVINQQMSSQNQNIIGAVRKCTKTKCARLAIHRYGYIGFNFQSALHSRQRRMQKCFVLEEMRMLPGPRNPIMNRLIRLVTGWTAQAFGLAGQIKMNLALLRFKADIRHLPWRLKTQGGCEQQIGIHAR